MGDNGIRARAWPDAECECPHCKKWFKVRKNGRTPRHVCGTSGYRGGDVPSDTHPKNLIPVKDKTVSMQVLAGRLAWAVSSFLGMIGHAGTIHKDHPVVKNLRDAHRIYDAACADRIFHKMFCAKCGILEAAHAVGRDHPFVPGKKTENSIQQIARIRALPGRKSKPDGD